MELCLPNTDRVNNYTVFTLIQSYVTYDHTVHTLHSITHYNRTLHTLDKSYITIITYGHTLHTIIRYIRMQVIQYVAITRSLSY